MLICRLFIEFRRFYYSFLLLGIYFSSYEIGLFSAPFKIVVTVCSAGFLIPMAFYPVFSEMYHNDKENFRKTYKKFQIIMIVLGFPVAIFGTIFSDEIIKLLLGDQYLKSIAVFKIIVWLVPLYFLRFTYGSLLFVIGKQVFYTVIGTIAIIIFCVGFLFTRHEGLIGLSILLLISDSLIVILLAYFFYKRT